MQFKKNIIPTAIGLIIGAQLSKFIQQLIDSLIAPLFSPDINNDGKNDMHNFINYTKRVGPFTFKFGNAIYSVCKFVIIMYIVFLISRLFRDAID